MIKFVKVLKNMKGLDVYICNNHNHSYVIFGGEKKCFINGCQNNNNSLITCVNIRPDLYYDHYKLIC